MMVVTMMVIIAVMTMNTVIDLDNDDVSAADKGDCDNNNDGGDDDVNGHHYTFYSRVSLC